jgi:hypothetical protein
MSAEGSDIPGDTEPGESVGRVRAFLDCGLMIDPWLGGLAEKCIEPAAERVARETARSVADRFWRGGLGTGADVQVERSRSQAVLDDPEATSMLILRTDPVVQDALGGLPWSAAQELIAEIAGRAREIFPRLSPEERLMLIPVESVRARVPEAPRSRR